MNDVHIFSVKRAIELSRLNDAERRVLHLLAEGHTAKSIAAELGTSPAAVNERLREARRKTGVGSSRELARLLRTQENRYDQMGVGSGHPVEATLPLPDAEPRRPEMGVYAMTAIFLVGVAGAAAIMTQQGLSPVSSENQQRLSPVSSENQQPLSPVSSENQQRQPAIESAIDPLIGEPLRRDPEPPDLHAKIRAETRDAQWAGPMESQIEARLMSMPLVAKDGNFLRVFCVRTLCEIGGTLLSPASKAEQEDQKSLFNRTVNDLQVPPLTDDLTHLGLKFENGSFMGGKGKPDRMVFLLYYRRADAKP